jgi:glyoxylase-like metal-dependent hydrolase (beta-lactamase superfamily II)
MATAFANTATMSLQPTVKDFYHEATNTCCFVVYDPSTRDAVILDSVTDFDVVNWQVSQGFNDRVLEFVRDEKLTVHYVMDTHVHADHLTGLAYIKNKLNVPTCIGERIMQVQKSFAALYNLPDFPTDGSQFDRLLKDKEVMRAGSLELTCWSTPGHTPACMSFIVGDCVFVGDLMFTEDFGCGRCDFPGGSAADMYDSVFKLYEQLHPDTRVFVGHDYQPGGRPLRVSSTIGLEAQKQEDLPKSGGKEDFVKGKIGYDKTLNLPRLIFPALLVNINAGRLPPAESNGQRYFKIPMNTRTPTDDLGVPLQRQPADRQ